MPPYTLQTVRFIWLYYLLFYNNFILSGYVDKVLELVDVDESLLSEYQKAWEAIEVPENLPAQFSRPSLDGDFLQTRYHNHSTEG